MADRQCMAGKASVDGWQIVSVFFNDPIPCDSPERRAVTLGLAMRDRTERLADEWRRRGHELCLGVGIATGFATCRQGAIELKGMARPVEIRRLLTMVWAGGSHLG